MATGTTAPTSFVGGATISVRGNTVGWDPVAFLATAGAFAWGGAGICAEANALSPGKVFEAWAKVTRRCGLDASV